jgi:glutamyl-tRNA synthetase
MPRTGLCVFQDHVRGQMEFKWADEQDHVIQRTDGSCLYHLASVVDDHAMNISHVIRAVEHLSNTPRQIFIAQGLGYELPAYAHLPFVAEPGGTAKMSKRKLDKYLKQKDFANLYAVGQKIADQIGLVGDQDSFNPVLVNFYCSIGFLPESVLNYLLLLGWSLDESSEDFSREQMIQLFSLDRVNKAPASFDPQKLMAFQVRRMNALSPDDKAQVCTPFLKAAGVMSADPDAATRQKIVEVIKAAGDRIKIAGDILDFKDFFVDDNQVEYDAQAYEKRLRKDEQAQNLLQKFRSQLETLEPFDVASTEQCLKKFVEAEGIKFNQIIHGLRVAVTGKAVGFGMFDALAILGREHCLNRIDRVLKSLSEEKSP